MLDCDWDPEKAETNKAKHGVTFDEACTVFRDSLALVVESAGTADEIRLSMIGMSEGARLLVVVFTDSDTIRIISARRPDKRERYNYENQ